MYIYLFIYFCHRASIIALQEIGSINSHAGNLDGVEGPRAGPAAMPSPPPATPSDGQITTPPSDSLHLLSDVSETLSLIREDTTQNGMLEAGSPTERTLPASAVVQGATDSEKNVTNATDGKKDS